MSDDIIYEGIDTFRARLAAGQVLVGTGVGLTDRRPPRSWPTASTSCGSTRSTPPWAWRPCAPISWSPVGAADYGRLGDAYAARADASLFVAVMIECVEAVEAIDAIVALPGLDGICLGRYDLSGSLGRLGDVEHPEVVTAMERVIAAARRRGLPIGSGMPADADFARRQVQRGVQWLQVGGDLGYLRQAVDDTVAAIRAGSGAPR